MSQLFLLTQTMSGEETRPVLGPASHRDSENGMSNSGFDPLNAGDNGSMSDTYVPISNSGSQKTDWKKYADESYQHYLSGCPGTYGGNELPSELPNVCFLPFFKSLAVIHLDSLTRAIESISNTEPSCELSFLISVNQFPAISQEFS